MSATVDVGRSPAMEAIGVESWARIEAALDRARTSSFASQREAALAHDALCAALTRHLIAMEVAVWPVVVQRLPSRRLAVLVIMTVARETEATMHDIEALFAGDALLSRHRLAPMHEDLVDDITEYRALEDRLLDAVDAALSPDERAAVVDRLAAVLRRAPTRPHPHAVRRLSWSRALYRPVALWDHFLDALDSRPNGDMHRGWGERGLWGSYFLGQPLARDENAEE